MSLKKTHVALSSLWLVALVVVVAARYALGYPLSMAGVLLLLAVGGGPIVALTLIFRGAPPQTVAEVIYDAEHPSRKSADRP